jgi:hypothetical protein
MAGVMLGQISLSPRNIGFALLAAFGTALALATLNLGPLVRVAELVQEGVRQIVMRRERIDLGDQLGTGGKSTIRDPREAPLLDRAIAPLARMLADAGGEQGRAWVERALVQLGYPSPYGSAADVYGCKVLYGAFGFAMGVMAGLVISARSGEAWPLALFPLSFAAIGYASVHQDISARLKKRGEHILFEMPGAIDRLIVLRLTRPSIDALVEAIGRVDEGGYVMRELRMVAEEYVVRKVPLSEAFAKMARRNADTPLLERLAERLAQASTEGSDLVPTLEVLAARARSALEVMIKQRGEQNRTLMIVPTLSGLLGIVAAMTAPALAEFGSFLAGP